MKLNGRFWLSALLGSSVATVAVLADSTDAVKVDDSIAKYAKVDGVRGNVNVVGSDTMVNMSTLWGEEFKKIYPEVNVSVEGKGSATAPPALAAGTSNIGPMSRPMKPEELDTYTSKKGAKPLEIKTSIDALAVVVHKDNPLANLTLELVDAIFSKTRKAGYTEDITTWGQLGLTGDWANKPISLYGRNSASGTYGYFKEHALAKGDFKSSVKEQPGTAAVVQGVAEDLYGIGYGGIGYITPGVRAIPLAKTFSDKVFKPTYENALSGKYPLARYLLVYIDNPPGKGPDAVVREYVKFILSHEGQEIAVKDGYMPLPPAIVAKELEKLNK
ncbi:MAG: PstS family phosphate ABC transporter substrate-binding protein [Planctomycetes bacterium]|nr:PstS family phosphate ABC transporter substrate-binding protein [Planctomycetota bacterium]